MLFEKITTTLKIHSPKDDIAKDSLLVVGLGNVGAKYESTRHNVGFMVLDKFVNVHNLQWQEDKKHSALVCKLDNATLASITHPTKSRMTHKVDRASITNVFLLKPQTFMNASGESVGAFAKFYKIKNMFVIHDDIDLGFGAMRYKQGGSSGGHNGLKSIDLHCGNAYGRMRVGVGRPQDIESSNKSTQNKQENVVSYVLSPFTQNQTQNLEILLSHSVEALEMLLLGENVAFLQLYCSKHAF